MSLNIQWEYGAKEEMAITPALGKSCSKTAHRITTSFSSTIDEGLQKNQPNLPAQQTILINVLGRMQGLISWKPLHAAHTKISGIKRTKLVLFTCRSPLFIRVAPSSHAIRNPYMLSRAFKSSGKKIINNIWNHWHKVPWLLKITCFLWIGISLMFKWNFSNSNLPPPHS